MKEPEIDHKADTIAYRLLLAQLLKDDEMFDQAWADFGSAPRASRTHVVRRTLYEAAAAVEAYAGTENAVSGIQQLVAEHTLKAGLEHG